MVKRQQLEIIKEVHEVVIQSMHSKAMAFHKGRDSSFRALTKMLNLTLSVFVRNMVI